MGSKNRGQRRQRSRETEERRRAKEKLTEKVRVDKEESLHQDETMVVKMWKRSSLGWRTVERARLERGRRGRRTTRRRGGGEERVRGCGENHQGGLRGFQGGRQNKGR